MRLDLKAINKVSDELEAMSEKRKLELIQHSIYNDTFHSHHNFKQTFGSHRTS
jgi:hypothetical protein